MKYSKGMLYGVLGLILVHPAYATVNCSRDARPDCASLGYTTTACLSGSYVECPYDKTLKKCLPESPTCEELGYTNTDKTSWCNGHIVACPLDAAYTLCEALSFSSCESVNLHTIGKNMLCESAENITLADGRVVTCGKDCYESCAEAGVDGEAIFESEYNGTEEYFGNFACTGDTVLLKKYYSTGKYRQVRCCEKSEPVYPSCAELGYANISCQNPTETIYIYTSNTGTTRGCCNISSCESIPGGFYSSPPSSMSCTAMGMEINGGTAMCFLCSAGSGGYSSQEEEICVPLFNKCRNACQNDNNIAACISGCSAQYSCCIRLGGVWGAC